MDWIIDHLGLLMFLAMALLLFTGFPVAFVLAGVSLAFGALGWALEVFNPLQFYNLLVRIWGGDESVVDLLESVGIVSAWEIMFFVMALVFILGFFFDWLEICLIVLPIFGPLLTNLDFGSHVEGTSAFLPWLLVVMAVNLQTSFLTPPFGFALFFMKGSVPPSVTMSHIYRGIVPFVLLQLVVLALCIAFPEVVLWLPRQSGLLD